MSEGTSCQREDEVQVDKSKKWGEENKRWKLYISRFFDCQYCEGYGMTEETLGTCHASWLEHFEFAYCRFHRYASSPPSQPPSTRNVRGYFCIKRYASSPPFQPVLSSNELRVLFSAVMPPAPTALQQFQCLSSVCNFTALYIPPPPPRRAFTSRGFGIRT